MGRVNWAAKYPGIYLTVPEMQEHFKGCVYVADLHRVMLPDGRMLRRAQFDITFGGKLFQMKPDGTRPTDSAFKAFTQCQATRFPQAIRSCSRPDLPTGTILPDGSVNAYAKAEPVTPKQDGPRGGFEAKILEAVMSGKQGFRGGWVSSWALNKLARAEGYRIGRNKYRSIVKGLGYEFFGQRPCPILLGRVDKRDSQGVLNVIQAGICDGDQLGTRPDVGRGMGVSRTLHPGRPRTERAQAHEPSSCSGWDFLDSSHRFAVA